MRQHFARLIALGFGAMLASSASGAIIYNNLTPNNLVAVASRPASSGGFEIETGDDFLLSSHTIINTASLVGLIVPSGAARPSVSAVTAEIYRVFPFDSDPTRTPRVPTRANSPSDDALDVRDSGASGLTYTTSVLAASFTALNTVQPGGIHPSPLQATGGNGALTGQEVQFDLTFTTPFDLQADHFFFVPQVQLTGGAQFYWLSASRPISGAGTTPFPAGVTDLQAWTPRCRARSRLVARRRRHRRRYNLQHSFFPTGHHGTRANDHAGCPGWADVAKRRAPLSGHAQRNNH